MDSTQKLDNVCTVKTNILQILDPWSFHRAHRGARFVKNRLVKAVMMLVVKGVMERAESQRQGRGGGFRLIQMNIFIVYI